MTRACCGQHPGRNTPSTSSLHTIPTSMQPSMWMSGIVRNSFCRSPSPPPPPLPMAGPGTMENLSCNELLQHRH